MLQYIPTSEIAMRDPFIFTHGETYFLYGKEFLEGWTRYEVRLDNRFVVWWSHDLENWVCHGPAYTKQDNRLWNQKNFCAPEVCYRNGKFYMTYTADSYISRRACGIAVSDNPLGPFTDVEWNPLTPPQWECLDSHVFIDDDGTAYLLYSHEWTQCLDGKIILQKLSDDLMRVDSDPVCLLKASEAPWCKRIQAVMWDGYVTDGAYMVRKDGKYHLFWSSFDKNGYCIACAVSDRVDGGYTHSSEPVLSTDCGHNNIFRHAHTGELHTCFHAPNISPHERVCIKKVVIDGDSVAII